MTTTKSAAPPRRLRNKPVGALVTLPFARGYKELFIGDRDTNGYSYLWESETAMDAGKDWVLMAAGSHLIREQ